MKDLTRFLILPLLFIFSSLMAHASDEYAMPNPDAPIDVEDSGLVRRYSQDDGHLRTVSVQKFLTQFDETKDEANSSKHWNYAARFFAGASVAALIYTVAGDDLSTQQRLEGTGAALGAFALGYLSVIVSDNYLMEAALTYNQAVLKIEY